MKISLFDRVLIKISKLIGGSKLTYAWDKEYASGFWDDIAQSRSRKVTKLCSSLSAREGLIVDCGCGEAWLYDALIKKTGWAGTYLGIDVSNVAIENAKSRNPAAKNADFVVSNLTEWAGVDGASVIIAEEILYYFNKAARKKIVSNFKQSLREDGAVLIFLHDQKKHSSIASEIVNQHQYSAAYSVGDRLAVIVCKSSDYLYSSAGVLEGIYSNAVRLAN